ncbi:hypothetical protein [Bradyrhizobium sp. USDA 223]|uniref:hypothetical protein n=1 Tax=Bradyrhizobium sp. USDA 223 TaxID=3156306 RepID=UPI0038398154
MHVGAAQTINLFGNDDQKECWLNTNNGALLGTYSTSERATGGHWWYNLSEASREGDNYLLNAEKSFARSPANSFETYELRYVLISDPAGLALTLPPVLEDRGKHLRKDKLLKFATSGGMRGRTHHLARGEGGAGRADFRVLYHRKRGAQFCTLRTDLCL